jgi:hypothetical protein
MSAKIVIACLGRPSINGMRRLKFHWNPDFNCYVYLNRVLDEREANEVGEEAIKKFAHLRPFMKVVQFSDEATATVQQTVHTTDPTPPQPAGQPQIITLEQALDVVQKLAPERLRKTPVKRAAEVEAV